VTRNAPRALSRPASDAIRARDDGVVEDQMSTSKL
jgi:hypothetical protein